MTLRLVLLALGITTLGWIAWRSRAEPPVSEVSVDSPAAASTASDAPIELRPVVPQQEPTPSRESSTPEPLVRREPVDGAKPRKSASKRKATLWIEVVGRETGAPMAGVRLTASRSKHRPAPEKDAPALEGDLWHSPRTDHAGRARFELSSGRYYMHAVWGEHGEGSLGVEVPELARGEERSQRIELPTKEDLRFFGRVLADETDAPIADADVIVTEAVTKNSKSDAEGWFAHREVARGKTDSEGRFDLTSASWKQVSVRVVAPGRVPEFATVSGEHATRDGAAIVRLQRSAVLVATILREGEPVKKGTLHVLGGMRDGRTDSEGRCRFEDLPAGVRIDVSLWNTSLTSANKKLWMPYSPAMCESLDSLILAPGEVCERTWQLGPLCTLRGVARDQDGVVLPRLRLRLGVVEPSLDDNASEGPMYIGRSTDLDSCEIRTDGGAFEVAGLHPGRWWIGPATGSRRDSYDDAAPFATSFTVTKGTNELWIDLEIDRGIYIEGTVLDPEGEPASGASVVAGGPRCSTDECGLFRLGPLARGEYWLQASKHGFDDSAPVSALAGASGVELRLQRGGTLRILSVDAAGNPLERCEVELLQPDSDRLGTWSGGQSVVWTGLPPGTYSIRSVGDDRIGFLSGIVIERGLEIERTVVVVDPIALLQVSSLDDRQGHLTIARDGALLCSTWLLDHVLVAEVPPGECKVVLTMRDGFAQEVQVLAVGGGATEVVFPAR